LIGIAGVGFLMGWLLGEPFDIVEVGGVEFLIGAAFDDIVGFSAEMFIRGKVFSGRNFIFQAVIWIYRS
jgi:hypothetical protein